MKTSISMMFVVLFISTALKVSAQEVAQTNIQPLNNSVSLISQLQPVSFNYDAKWAQKLKISGKTQLGFVTADVQKVLPELVKITAKDYPTGKNASRTATLSKIDYESLIPLLVGSIKEQQQQIEQLRRELDSLKSRNTK
ncbi:tail fiber domain-containing protein [Pedobacter rhodius]|uniref:Tail fiber domain-containing protein n=1 Tax=Pedobacter rhodius TaxID=3004098 RepID=A0ABT4KZW0_9SPHI|nr:tail fiber domain-containing protein [Pedobacter sp. SJ11]MCZ4224466.1 tail fiber domain-containing protein [Pedobacter sp. SJ11]